MKKILFTISLTFLAGYAMAQETMSLGRCLQMGIERNLNLKTYEGNVLKGKHNVSENRSRLLPQINMDVSSLPFTPNREMFVVHAKGNSMLPKIKDGDLCVFERYQGGSREGEIVLSQVNEYYEEYGGKYTIKKFHSEKTVNEEGVEVHSKIELQPLNKDGFQTIEILEDNEANIAVVGILKYIIR